MRCASRAMCILAQRDRHERQFGGSSDDGENRRSMHRTNCCCSVCHHSSILLVARSNLCSCTYICCVCCTFTAIDDILIYIIYARPCVWLADAHKRCPTASVIYTELCSSDDLHIYTGIARKCRASEMYEFIAQPKHRVN